MAIIPRNALARLRVAAGLTQSTAAEQVGVTATYLCSIECGEAMPSLLVIRALARVYGVELSAAAAAVRDSYETGKAMRRYRDLRDGTGPFAPLTQG